MSLQWDFKNKIGYVNTEENTLYHGNALIIMLFETEKEYQMQTFFCDKEHEKDVYKITCLKLDTHSIFTKIQKTKEQYNLQNF